MAPDIDWREGSADALPVGQDERFDVVFCHQGLQFFPDRPAAVREMRRVTAPGGRLVVGVWRSMEHNPFFQATYQASSPHLGPFTDQRHAFGDAAALERLLSEGGFRGVRVEPMSLTLRFEDGPGFVRMNSMALVGMSPAARQMGEERARLLATVIEECTRAAAPFMSKCALLCHGQQRRHGDGVMGVGPSDWLRQPPNAGYDHCRRAGRHLSMRKVVFGGANSLDNYIARPDDGVDWLMWGDEAAAVMAEFWPRFDTVLMGRRTWEVAAKSGMGGGGYPGVTTYVFSRTLTEAPNGVQLVREDAAGFVTRLKEQEGKDICLMGGGDLARTFFEAGLIDEIGFNIHPVLLGRGIPLFHAMDRQINLELTECRRFKNGCVYVTYRVKNDG